MSDTTEGAPPHRRRPWVAFLLSSLAPGLGQLYAGFPLRALVAFLAWLMVAATMVWLFLNPDGGALGIGLAALLILVALLAVPIDAGIVARSGKPLPVNRWIRLGIYIAVLVAFSEAATRAATWVRSDIVESFRVPAAGMVPTLYPGDHFFVDKRSYDHPRRGDVIVFWAARDGTQVVPADSDPDLPREQFLKRVLAVPGDRIRITGGTVYLNGSPVPVSPAGTTSENGRDLELFTESIDGGTHTIAQDPNLIRPDFPEVVVSPDRYFVLGDNRDYSRDSRHYGTVLRSEIIGQASHIYFSLHPATGHLAWARVGMRVR